MYFNIWQLPIKINEFFDNRKRTSKNINKYLKKKVDLDKMINKYKQI